MPVNDHRPVFILTGETGSGKTTFLMKLIEELRSKAFAIAGFIALSVHEDGTSGSYTLLDLVSGKILPLASRKITDGWEQIRNFYFNPAGLLMGKEILDDPLIFNNDLIVIDEVGPFELDGKVWADSVNHLLSGQNASVLMVVRAHLINRVMQIWNLEDAMVIEIGQAKPDQVAAAIMSQAVRK